MRQGLCTALLVAGLLVGGCGGGDSHATPPPGDSLPISTSSWKPGDMGMDALIRGTLRFARDGCPMLAPHQGVVWPAHYTAVVKPNGDHVVVTADGREIASGDIVIAGGGVGTRAPSGMTCIRPGTAPTYIESEVQIVRGP